MMIDQEANVCGQGGEVIFTNHAEGSLRLYRLNYHCTCGWIRVYFQGKKSVILMNEGIGNKTFSRKDYRSPRRMYHTSEVKRFGACIVLFVTL